MMPSSLSPQSRDRVLHIEAARILGTLTRETPQVVLDVAFDLISEGHDSTALVELAGLYPAPLWEEALDAWSRWLPETGLPPLDEAKAAQIVVLPRAKAIARRFLEGTLEPDSAIRELEALNFAFGHREFLHDCCILCSEWDYLTERADALEHGPKLRVSTEMACRELLALPEFDPDHPETHEPARYVRYA